MKLLWRLRSMDASHPYDGWHTSNDSQTSTDEADMESLGIGTMMPVDIPSMASKDYPREFEVNFC